MSPWWTFFRWFQLLPASVITFAHTLPSQIIPQSFQRDIRYWAPAFSIEVRLVGQNQLPLPSTYSSRALPYPRYPYRVWIRIRHRHCRFDPVRRPKPSLSNASLATSHTSHQPDYATHFDLATEGYQLDFPANGHKTFQQYYGITKDHAFTYLQQTVIHPLEWYQQEKRLLDPTTLSSTRQTQVDNRAFIAATQILHDLGAPRDPCGERHTAFIQNVHGEHRNVPIVVDTGASFALSPFLDDFVSPLEQSECTELIGLSGNANVEGIANVEWEIRDVCGQLAVIKTRAYYVPSASIRIFSPQAYFRFNGTGHGWFNHEHLKITTVEDIELTFPYNQGNIPMMRLNDSLCNLGIGSPSLPRASIAGVTAPLAYALRYTDALTRSQDLLNDLNINLTKPQKEVILWHSRCAHAGVSWIQDLMCVQKGNHGEQSAPPILPSKHNLTKRCDMNGSRCPACLLAKQHQRSTGHHRTQAKPEREMAIRRDAMRPGQEISGDQYICRTPGRLAHTKGKENVALRYHGGTIFVDHYSGFIHIGNQVSLRAGETLQTKRAFDRFASEHGVKLQHFRLDNHPFGAREFREDLDDFGQTISFSGVGAHHQNGVAERAQSTVMSWTRSQLLHQLLHWPEGYSDDLWPFALENAVYVWNHLPDRTSGLSPLEKFTGKKIPTTFGPLSTTRVWGCPSFVLDPTLQDGRKLPKFKKRSRCGVYLGKSLSHSNSVGLILNPETGHISPQFHVVYDELYSTVFGRITDEVFDTAGWNQLLELQGEENLLDDHDLDDPAVLSRAKEMYRDYSELDPDLPVPREPPPALLPPPSAASVPEGDGTDIDSEVRSPDMDETSASEGDDTDDEMEDHYRLRNRNVRKPPPKPIARKRAPEYASTLMLPSKYEHHPAKTHAPHVQQTYLAGGQTKTNRKVPLESVNDSSLHSIDWNPASFLTSHSFDTRRALRYLMRAQEDGVAWEPTVLGAILGAKGNDPENNPTWDQAMHGPLAEGYMEAARKEIKTLVDMGCWEEVDRQPWMNVLPSTWTFKKKLYPSGLVRKLKGRFCARGDRQIQNVDYFDTFAPVVSWTTVRLLLILSVQLSLATKQVDYTSAFVHADIDKPPNFHMMTKDEQDRTGVYVDMPRGFSKSGKVLKLNRSLYGLKQSPRNFFLFLKSKLENIGFEQALDVDPCLFISDKVICLVYVDDTLLFARSMKDIDDVLHKLEHEQNMGLEVEDDVAGFLGVHMARDEESGTVTLTQRGLIDKIVEALGCQDLPPVSTPADLTLGRDEDGDPPNCTFSYPSVIGMLWCVYGHSRPDLGFAISQAAGHAFQPKRSHELALIRIGQYLKGTADKGLILKPFQVDQFQLDVYVDSDFMGRFGKEKPDNPDNVKSRGGHVLLLNGCPIVWSSKLLGSICLSTMMAEYYALSEAMREVLPLRNLVRAVGAGLGLDPNCLTQFKTTTWEDNAGALSLANLEPGQHTPRSKYYDVKVHWFKSHLTKLGPDPITIEKIPTDLNIADLFTKPLKKDTFEYLRFLLMGW